MEELEMSNSSVYHSGNHARGYTPPRNGRKAKRAKRLAQKRRRRAHRFG